jgi:signal transduction histidine kinase
LARMHEALARPRHELQRVQDVPWLRMPANILVVASVLLLAAIALRRHLQALRHLTRRRDQLEAEAVERAADLNEVFGHLQTVQEQERSRLARGLHDELGGLLLAARMDVSWLQQHWPAAEGTALARRLARVLEVLDEGIDLKRRVVEELRPTLLDNMGLIAAIRWQMDETCGRGGIRCHGDFPEREPDLSARAAIALFRVAQEALRNVQKHAGAHEIRVRLEVTPEGVALTVRDDGKGIRDADRRKAQAFGLAGMKHRINALGGTLSVSHGVNGGTLVRATIPHAQAYTSRAEPRVGATSIPRHTRR